MGKAVEITDATFEDIIQKNELVLIDFWAEWCGPCRMLGPTIDELAQDYEGKLIIGKVDVDSNPQASSKYSVRSIPTVLLFKKGEIIDKQLGAVPKKVLTEKIDTQLAAS